MLEIVSLGGLSIRRDGEQLSPLATRKAEALLIYLACSGRTHPREVLADLLWEERSQEQALTNLRKAIAELRREAAPYMVITRQTVGLNASSGVRLDTAEFEAGLRVARQEWEQALSPGTITALERTLALYQGDFLAGFTVRASASFESWLGNERERLRRLVIEGLHHVIEAHLNRRAFSAGIVQAARLLYLDPLHEEAHRQMMTLLALTGQRHEALHQYETCKHLLIDELGLEPAIETTALHETIQAGTLTHVPTPVHVTTGHRAEPLSGLPPQRLPLQNTPFIGRIPELAQIAERLADPHCHLLTLVGAGGIGKTRLALQAAYEHSADFAQGTHFVSLAAVTSADAIVFAIGGALDILFESQESPALQLSNALRDKEMLLVLDNFEHLLAAAPLVADLLSYATRLKLLITSRERLNLLEEWALPVEGMDYPQADDGRHAESFSAVQLFAYNARRVQSRFSLFRDNADVVRICQLVEGMPLGIELAAAWVRMLPCKQIADQLASDLDFLASPLRNVPERHRSLRAVFDQSWVMLSPDERLVLAKLSVFRGSFDPQAAEQIAQASLETLAALTDKSLIRVDAEGRCHLHELLRAYAAEELESTGQSADIAHAHLAYFLSLADRAEAEIYGPKQISWLDRLEIEHDNLRAALSWSLTSRETEIGLALAVALSWFWLLRHHEQEGYEWSTRLLAITNNASSPFRLRALCCTASLAIHLDKKQGQVLGEEALRLARAVGDKWSTAWSLTNLGFVLSDRDAIAAREEALLLFRELGDAWGISHTLRRLAVMMHDRGNYERARMLIEEALSMARMAGDKSALAWSLLILGDVCDKIGDLPRSVSLYEESLPVFGEIRDNDGTALVHLRLGKMALDQGNCMLAQTHYEKSLVLFFQGKERRWAMWGSATCLVGLGRVAWKQTRSTLAVKVLSAAIAFFDKEPEAHVGFFDLNEQMAEIRLPLAEPAFTAAWAEGQQMTMQQAVAYILEKSGNAA